MTGKAEPPSLSAMAAQTERTDQGLLALRRELASLTVTARDGHEIVEVVVDSAGKLTDVALNTAYATSVDVATLAGAMLQAAQAAQRDAQTAVGELRSYYLGT